MLKWAIIFLIIALICGAFGFTSAASAAALIAKILFAIFLIGFIILLILGFTLV